MDETYDPAGLQSLFGYGRAAHLRSGGICELCGSGAGPIVDFDLWRQLTIEHLIGVGQGGYPPAIRLAVDQRFRHLDGPERRALASQVHELNIVTACQFCNSATSRDRAPFTMEQAIAELPDDTGEALAHLRMRLDEILEAKRRKVHWKLASVYRAFRETIEPQLVERRQTEPRLQEPRSFAAFDAPSTSAPLADPEPPDAS